LNLDQEILADKQKRIAEDPLKHTDKLIVAIINPHRSDGECPIPKSTREINKRTSNPPRQCSPSYPDIKNMESNFPMCYSDPQLGSNYENDQKHIRIKQVIFSLGPYLRKNIMNLYLS